VEPLERAAILARHDGIDCAETPPYIFTDRRFNWCYTTEPQPGCHNRKVIAPRGKVLGGSSSINGLIYIRGQVEDFNLWWQLGNVGWSFAPIISP
jgi:choline dehydrogenase